MRCSSPARKAAKAAVLPLGVARHRRPGDVLALLYHRVGASEREVDVPLGLFDRQIGAIAARDHVISLDEALAGRGGVVVTVDDGYRDFAECVVPALLRHRVPAVLYLATGLVAGASAPAASRRERLSWADLRDCVATGLVTVGAHTHSHPDLSRADERFAAGEMRRSKELVEDRLGTACRHFAYPFAVASPEAERAARQLFDSAAIGAWRTNRAGSLDPYRIGRTPVLSSDGTWLFRAKTLGWLDGEALLYRATRRGPWSRSRPGAGAAGEAAGQADHDLGPAGSGIESGLREP